MDWLYARTNTTLNTAFHHRLNFSQKRLSPFIRTLQHIGNFWEVKSSASCPIFYTFNGCAEITKQSFRSESNLLSSRDKCFLVLFLPKTCNEILFKQFILDINNIRLKISPRLSTTTYYKDNSIFEKSIVVCKRILVLNGVFLNGNFITNLHLSVIETTRYK